MSVYVCVISALQDLETGQLLLFVQSFGLPIPSMSRLLHCLDQAVQADSNLIEQVVVDKGYMSQLIEVVSIGINSVNIITVNQFK